MRTNQFLIASACGVAAAAVAAIGNSLAQETEVVPTVTSPATSEASAPQPDAAEPNTPNVTAAEETADSPISDAAETASAQTANNINVAESTENSEPTDPDAIADQLNSQQQLKQTVTFTRKINGTVVETGKRSVTFKPGDPVRSTEASGSPIEALKVAFDGEVLTRVEALDEAKSDFLTADANRDKQLSSDEFVALLNSWGEQPSPGNAGVVEAQQTSARQKQYDAFLDEIDPGSTSDVGNERARKRFAFIAGASLTISQKDYIAEYLLDFDSMDANEDMLLQGEELINFRALNRGNDLSL
ncbi:MAG: hypothetical protein AAF850_08115 [Pseudomonadota bacterium]